MATAFGLLLVAGPLRDPGTGARLQATCHVASDSLARAQLAVIIGSMVMQALRSHRRAIFDAAARHGALNVRVFGSTARGDSRPDSDVDLLVNVEKGRSLLDVIALEQDLEELLGVLSKC